MNVDDHSGKYEVGRGELTPTDFHIRSGIFFRERMSTGDFRLSNERLHDLYCNLQSILRYCVEGTNDGLAFESRNYLILDVCLVVIEYVICT